MGRFFQGTTTSKLEIAEAIVTTRSFTLACHFLSDDAATLNRTLISISDGTSDNLFRLFKTTGLFLAAQSVAATSSAQDTGTTSIAAGTWYHGAAVYVSGDKDYVYLNGVKDGAGQGTQKVPTGLNTTTIGIREGTAHPWDGTIAEVCIFDVALTDNEVMRLYRGENPNEIRSASNLKCYVTCWGVPATGSEVDLSGNQKSFTIGVTADTLRPHPPVAPYRRKTKSYFLPTAAAGSSIPVFMYNYRRRRA